MMYEIICYRERLNDSVMRKLHMTTSIINKGVMMMMMMMMMLMMLMMMM